MKGFYSTAVRIITPLCAILYPRHKHKLPALPEGAAIVCANHSNYIDPVLIALTAGPEHWIRFMAKIELSRIKILDWVIKKLGSFYVDRNSNDLGAIRTSMSILKSGNKLGIFPEGTRVSEDDAVAAKAGAVRLAMRMGVPVIPVYVTRNKRIFRKCDVVFGEAYMIDKNADDQEETAILMEKIHALAPVGRGGK